MLQARLSQLSLAALNLAEVVAACGRPCRYDVLARTCADSEASFMQAFDELWHRRILRETPGDSYDFTHEKLREVCYHSMSAARRRWVQQRLDEASPSVARAA